MAVADGAEDRRHGNICIGREKDERGLWGDVADVHSRKYPDFYGLLCINGAVISVGDI